jgi:N-acetylglucosaminyldiphosphoundecaprenol N-acetyl-beta-D-mannosaminyltransferase
MEHRIEIAGVPFDAVTYADALSRIDDFVDEGKRVYITTPNPEMLVYADRNPDYKTILRSGALAVPDGTGILWSAHYLALPKRKSKIGQCCQLIWSLAYILIAPGRLKNILPQRVTGADLFEQVVKSSQHKDWWIFLLGGDLGVAEHARKNLLKKYPGAKITGTYHGDPKEEGDANLQWRVNSSRANILFVAFGNPKQEEWIHRNLPHLPHVNVAVGVGGAFDFASRRIKRAPVLMRRLGLEWLWRLARQPGRIIRIWNATYRFIRLIEKEKNAISAFTQAK